MGVYDRDYYRRDGPSFLGSITETGKVCKYLILVNVACFVVQFLTLGGGATGLGPFTSALALTPIDVLHGQVWRLLTFAFLHDPGNLLHIVLNMLVLWWFGSDVEEIYGPREFLAFYLMAAVGSGVLDVLWSIFTGATNTSVVLGASGAVLAVFVLFACHYPRRIVYIFLVIPCPVWLLVVLYAANDVLGLLAGGDGVAHAAHLGGALFGLLYFKSQLRLVNLVPDFKAWRKRQQQPRLRVYRGESQEEDEPQTPVAVPAAPAERDSLDEQLEAKLDAVLEKVARVGKENLTENERQILLRASELYRKRRS